MRHFGFLTTAEDDRLFALPPERFDVSADRALLATALGATLYCPATRATLARDIARRSAEGVVSFVVCLEDAVADGELAAAETNAIAQLRALADNSDVRPMVFVRVRDVGQIRMVVDGLETGLDVLSGFVLPKFDEESVALLDAVVAAGDRLGRRLYAMPVLESPELIFAETRVAALLAARQLLDKYRETVLAVRVGATDFSAAYGLRRSRDVTVYDVRVLADVIGDIVNVFARAHDGFVVTGPVWEYFSRSERILKPQLRVAPFEQHDEAPLRARLIASDLDALLREVVLDRANGLLGKSVIHPSHVAPVHSLSVVTHEEYCDALDVLGTNARGGASASLYGNKMNESKPHTTWARRTLLRARAFGVAREGVSFVDLLSAGSPL